MRTTSFRVCHLDSVEMPTATRVAGWQLKDIEAEVTWLDPKVG
jgi:hypothetical protein